MSNKDYTEESYDELIKSIEDTLLELINETNSLSIFYKNEELGLMKEKDYIKDIYEWNEAALVSVGGDTTANMKLVEEELDEFFDEVDRGDVVNQTKELVDVIWTLVGYARAKNLPLVEALEEVSASNWSKFQEDNFDDATMLRIDEELDLFKEKGVAASARFFRGKVVYVDSNDKVIKPSTYVKADINKLFEE